MFLEHFCRFRRSIVFTVVKNDDKTVISRRFFWLIHEKQTIDIDKTANTDIISFGMKNVRFCRDSANLVA